MLFKIFAVLVLLWLAGLVTPILLGGLVHLLLIVVLFAIVVESMTEKEA